MKRNLLICATLLLACACKKEKDGPADFRMQYVGAYTCSGTYGYFHTLDTSYISYDADTTMNVVFQLHESDSQLRVLGFGVELIAKAEAGNQLYKDGGANRLSGYFFGDSLYLSVTGGGHGGGYGYHLRGRKK